MKVMLARYPAHQELPSEAEVQSLVGTPVKASPGSDWVVGKVVAAELVEREVYVTLALRDPEVASRLLGPTIPPSIRGLQ